MKIFDKILFGSFIAATILFFGVALAGCGKHEDTQNNGLSPSAIPDANCSLYSNRGSHLFSGSGSLLRVDAFDCGTREGKMCWYYVHYSDSTGTDQQEVRCFEQ